ncbi:MAG: N-acetylglucosamine-6-phosphate deacetylase [Leptolyngbya sp.]|nr:N-acetylglucosamine-6-phosphate deacetylase [Leptolyngbya sp.]
MLPLNDIVIHSSTAPRYALTQCTLYTGHRILKDHALIIDGDTILDLVPTASLPSDMPCQLGSGIAAPGFIDLQLNGCGGVMFNDAIAPETLDTMHRTNLRSGTTSFLPTLITTADEAMDQAIALMDDYRQQRPDRVLGLHLEGPYLNPKRKGIHDGRYVRPADEAMIAKLVAAGPDRVRMITLAPEQVSADQIRRLVAAGIQVSAGHSDATFEAALAGFEAGISLVTHLFNAMSPWQGRSPGLVGATFRCPEVYAGIIVDGHHVHFDSVHLAHRLKGDHLVLVSDATPPVGTTMDSFRIGGQTVFYREGKCVSAEGTLGGSALTLMEAVGHCVDRVGIPLAEALRMASLYPARAIGLDHRLGRLAPGYRANVVMVDPQTWSVKAVIDQGVWQGMAT